jgi:uncharacterized protein
MKTSALLKNLILFLSVMLLSIAALQAQNYPDKPNPPRLVNDFASLLASGEVAALESKLDTYNDSTSTQISIVIINSLEGEEIAQYATELGEKWGIGRKHKDNGVLLLVSKGDRQIFIATGRGVEEYLTDAVCERIIQGKIKPAFKAGNYYQGLNAATDEMIARLSGTFKNEDGDDAQHGIPGWVIILIILVIAIFVLGGIFGGGGGGGSTLSNAGTVLWALGSMTSGGGGGGSSGGGFGGFGGGDFGGGGAGGSW